MKYEVYQIKDNNNARYEFMGYDWALSHGFNLDDYEKVYEGNIVADSTPEDTCELIFIMLNQHRPEDFHGHSLSVSDIVVINGQRFYTDSIGFRKIQ